MKIKGVDKRRRKIHDEVIGATGRRVFLVEGERDRDAFSQMLEKKFGHEFERRWAVAWAGSKELVIGILAKEPNWIGLVDRDDWMEETISAKLKEFPNLNVLPRFCLENYLIEPSELWNALPDVQKRKIPGGVTQFKAQINVDQSKWVRHGVLRTVINPLWDVLIARGFQRDLLSFENAQDDTKIQATLQKWSDLLNPEKLFEEFDKRLKLAGEKSSFEQITLWIDGKECFKSHVHQVLNRFLGQQRVDERIKNLFNGIQFPADLEFLWEKFGL